MRGFEGHDITHRFPSSAHETVVGLGVKQPDLTRSPAYQTGSLWAHGCRCREQELAGYEGDRGVA